MENISSIQKQTWENTPYQMEYKWKSTFVVVVVVVFIVLYPSSWLFGHHYLINSLDTNAILLVHTLCEFSSGSSLFPSLCNQPAADIGKLIDCVSL